MAVSTPTTTKKTKAVSTSSTPPEFKNRRTNEDGSVKTTETSEDAVETAVATCNALGSSSIILKIRNYSNNFVIIPLTNCYFYILRDRKNLANVKKYGKQPMRNQKNQAPIKNRDASVTVRPDWNTIEEMDFPRLSKLSLPNVKEAEDM